MRCPVLLPPSPAGRSAVAKLEPLLKVPTALRSGHSSATAPWCALGRVPQPSQKAPLLRGAWQGRWCPQVTGASAPHRGTVSLRKPHPVSRSARPVPYLSESCVGQRPLPAPGAVLDVAGGGQGEEAEEGEGQRRLCHGAGCPRPCQGKLLQLRLAPC